MKEYNISVRVEGYEYYTVIAESEEDAITLIKNGDGNLQYSETEWVDDLYVDHVVDLEDED